MRLARVRRIPENHGGRKSREPHEFDKSCIGTHELATPPVRAQFDIQSRPSDSGKCPHTIGKNSWGGSERLFSTDHRALADSNAHHLEWRGLVACSMSRYEPRWPGPRAHPVSLPLRSTSRDNQSSDATVAIRNCGRRHIPAYVRKPSGVSRTQGALAVR